MTTNTFCQIDYENPISLIYLYPETEISNYFFENFSNLTTDSNIYDLLYQPDNQTGKGKGKINTRIAPLKCNIPQKISIYVMLSTALYLVYKSNITGSIIIFLKANCVPTFIITIMDFIDRMIKSMIGYYFPFLDEENSKKLYNFIINTIIGAIFTAIKMLHDIIKKKLGYSVTDEKLKQGLVFDDNKSILNNIIGDLHDKLDPLYNNLVIFYNRLNIFIDYICVSIYYKKKQDGGIQKSRTYKKKHNRLSQKIKV